MKPIQDFLKASVKERLAGMQEELIQDPSIQDFMKENPGVLTSEMFTNQMSKLYEYASASHACDKCPTLAECQNIMKGYEPKLLVRGERIEIAYRHCPRKSTDEESRIVQKMVQSFYMPKEVMRARLSTVDLDRDDSRFEVLEKAHQFLSHYEKHRTLPKKGLYIHGPFGTGKSYILGAIANELALRRVKTVVVYVPEFLREMKQAIQDQTLSEKLNFVKESAVLMLDDIGAESLSAWSRDEVLGTIVQHRMAEELPTFFTSNFDYLQLEDHFQFAGKDREEPLKAARIMERIQAISEPVVLDGKNFRDKS